MYVAQYHPGLKEENKKLVNVSFYPIRNESNFVEATLERLTLQWSTDIEPTVEMKFNELYSMVDSFSKEIENLKKQIKDLQLNKNSLALGNTSKVVVQDYPNDVIEANKTNILTLLEKRDSIDPFDYAEEAKIDVDLALLCFDELIDQGKLVKAK
ncbi:MAG: hypothetical protein AAE987_06455 [Thermoplasmataceae archaeon]|jgi:hypothetical protein